MKHSSRIALGLGFFLGLGIQLALAQPVDNARFRNVIVTNSLAIGNDLSVADTATIAVLDAGVLNVEGQVSISGPLIVRTPSDIVLGTASEITLGNAATSLIRGGGGFLRLDDAIGASLGYTGSALTIDGNTTLTNTAGRVSVSGDVTAPVSAAFRIIPQDAQPTGAHVVGDIYVTTAGVLRICTAAGTPGTWVNVGAQ